jgi:hypothetical protein
VKLLIVRRFYDGDGPGVGFGARPDERGAGRMGASRKEAHLGVPAAPSMGAAFDRLDRSVKDPKTIGAERPSRGAIVRQAGKLLRQWRRGLRSLRSGLGR